MFGSLREFIRFDGGSYLLESLDFSQLRFGICVRLEYGDYSGQMILFDATNLCYRAYHAFGQVEGIAVGLIKEIEKVWDLFGRQQSVFAFDSRFSFRKLKYPEYKANRKKNAKDAGDKQAMYDEIRRVRMEVLPRAGFRNVLVVRGFEADDILAQLALELPLEDRAVIVSTDKDLWQCLRSNVECRNPISGKIVTRKKFWEEWKVFPEQWPTVKAMAGCASDNVVGIKGIGEKSAALWLRNKLSSEYKLKLIADNLAVVTINLPLVALPYGGLPHLEICDDAVTDESWHSIQVELGIRSPRVRARKALL